MNELDLRLREELHRGDAEIEVTETDVSHAVHRFLRRRNALRQQHRAWTAAGVAAAAVAAIAGGSVLVQTLDGPEVPPAEQDDSGLPTPDDPTGLSEESLSGTYMVDDRGGWLWTFAGGTVSIRNPGEAQSGTFVFPYSVSGTRMTWPTGQCVFEAALDGRGVLDLTVVEKPGPGVPAEDHTYCPEPRRFTLTRLTPASPDGAALQPVSGLPDDPADLERLRQMRGAWLKQGTGMLLTITADTMTGEFFYELDDGALLFGAPDDQGTATLDGRGGLVLTSSRSSAGCEPGSSLTLSQVRIWGDLPPGGYKARASRMEVLSADPSGCAVHAELGGSWVRVS